MTPDGWKKIIDLRIGDSVVTPRGLRSKVIQIHYQGLKDFYKLETIDGGVTYCTDEHLWRVHSVGLGGYWRIVDTNRLKRMIKKRNVSIPLIEKIGGYSPRLEIKPYTLGALLGDGCFREKRSVFITTDDKEIVDNIERDGYVVRKRKAKLNYSILKIHKKIKSLGLDMLKSEDKFIPREYLEASWEDRLSLLQGLMDTDGTCSDGKAYYCSVSKRLAKDVQTLVWSLGGKATITRKENDHLGAYIIYICFNDRKIAFRLKRKKDRATVYNNGNRGRELTRRVKSITKAPIKADCLCITLDDEDGLYITDDFIVTHNSWAIRTKQILRRFMYPQSRGLLLRRTYPELLENHIYKIQEEWKGLDWNAKDARFVFPNGSYLKLGSAQFEQDVMKYSGSEFEDIGIDECTNFTEYQFNILDSCLRTTKKGLNTQMYLGGNPGGVGHGWVKRKFINQQLPNHHFIPAKVYDNPILMDADPDYMERLKLLPEDLRKAYLEGDWDVFSGQVFSEWHQQKHIVSTFDYPIELCKKTIGFDWGFNAPACALWLAHTPDERVYVYREIYQNGKNPEEWANMIKEYTASEEVEKTILPHDCFSNVQGNKSIADTFEEIGVPNIVRAKTLNKNSRKNRVAIMHQYLSEAPDGKPYLQVHKKCENLIRTLPELIYSETNPEDVNSESEDHAYDSLAVALLDKVLFSTNSGAVAARKPFSGQLDWTMTPYGIESPDFIEAFKEEKTRRDWKYI